MTNSKLAFNTAWQAKMTAAEYKAWVEKGIFPDRLKDQK